MNPVIINDVKSAGLPEKAAIVYAFVLESGSAFPSKIAEATKLNRSTVYKVLNDLHVRGLVTKIEHNKKLCYQIEDPVQLKIFADKQIDIAKQRFENVNKILPELQGLFSLLPNKPRVRFFEGLSGILTVYTEHISEEEPYEMISYSNVEELMKLLPPKFVKEYVKKKENLKIYTRAIFPDSKFSSDYNKTIYPDIQKKFLVNFRTIPSKDFPFKAEVTMFGKNKISIINFHENALIGVIIEDSAISGVMRMVFELAWKGAEK